MNYFNFIFALDPLHSSIKPFNYNEDFYWFKAVINIFELFFNMSSFKLDYKLK